MSSETTNAPESTAPDTRLSREALLAKVHEQSQHIEQLRSAVDDKSGVITHQKQRISFLEEALRLSKHQRFGKSSEQNALQPLLFNEAELASLDQAMDIELPSGDVEDTDIESDTAPEKKRKGNPRGRQPLSPDLPRVQHYFYLSDEDKAGASETFFTKVKEELDIEPAKAQVIEYYQEKAVFKEDGQRQIVAATRTPHPLGKAIASVTLLAYIICGKYADGIPLYRLETILKRYGGGISRSAMALWMVRLSTQLQPVVNLLEDALLSGDHLAGDETRMKVLKEPGTEASSHKWVWLMRGGPPDKPVVMFNYDKSRGKGRCQTITGGLRRSLFPE